jgi:hypothetical protein
MRQRGQHQCIALPVPALQLHAAAGEGAWFGLGLQRGRRQQSTQRLRVIGAGADAITAGTQDRAEHVAGLHRRQLVGIAEQDQPRAAGDRVDQLGHHRQIDHRGFVDHHHVHRQRIVGVVAEARRIRDHAEQAMQGGAGTGQCRAQRRVHAVLLQALHGQPQALGHAFGGAPGGRGQRHLGQRLAGVPGLCASSSNRRAMVVVLPVPGPPVTSASGWRRVTPAARAW